MVTFRHPFTCLVSGPSGSGKSVFCIRFLRHIKHLCSESRFDSVIWAYSESGALPHIRYPRLTFHRGVPAFDDGDEDRKPRLIILDDLLNEAYSKEVCALFIKGSHHRNISVFLITQNLFHQGPYCRDISLNAKYIVALKNTRDKNQFLHLARQVYPENPTSLYGAYLDATKLPHGYLVLDLTQEANDLLRFQTNIFPPEPTVVYAPLQHETNLLQLQDVTAA